MKENKRKIKIKFVDFWEHWNETDNFIVNTLKKKYVVELSEKPDYVFFSNFNNKFNHMLYNDCVKIFYTQENISPDFNFCDYAISFEYLTYLDRHLRFPIFLIKERYESQWIKMMKKHIFDDFENILNEKKEFCSFVVSNGKSHDIRKEMFEKLSEYKKVNSGGKYMNNIGEPKGVKDKYEFTLKHKFSLCFENSSHPGYCTEKLIEAFAAKTIPIYWGDNTVDEYFNEESFINVNNYLNIDEAIKKIIEIDQNDNLYKQMIETPAIKSKYIDLWQEKQNELENFLYNIFEQPYESAFRRNRVFWGKEYENKYKLMRKSYLIIFENVFFITIKNILKLIKKMYKMIKY